MKKIYSFAVAITIIASIYLSTILALAYTNKENSVENMDLNIPTLEAGEEGEEYKQEAGPFLESSTRNTVHKFGVHHDEADPEKRYLLFELPIHQLSMDRFEQLTFVNLPKYFEVTDAAYVLPGIGMTVALNITYVTVQYLTMDIEQNVNPAMDATIKIYGHLNPNNYLDYIENGVLDDDGYTIYYAKFTNDTIHLQTRYSTVPTFKLHEAVSRHETALGETLFPETTTYGLLGEDYHLEPEESDDWVLVDILGEATGTFGREPAEVTFIYDIAEVTFIFDQVSVEYHSPQFLLGTNINNLNPSDWVTLYRGDDEISEEEYEVELLQGISTWSVGRRALRVQITYNGVREAVYIPAQVIWGSTINISGAWWYTEYEFRSVAAYTLHPGEGITFAPGQEASSLRYPSLPQAYEEIFSRFSILSGREKIVIEETEPIFEFETIRSYTPTELAEQFDRQSGGKPVPVTVGDVVESWHVFQNLHDYVEDELDKRLWNVLIENNQRVNASAGLNTVYYEVMEDHFRPLVVNQGSAIKGQISYRTSNLELEQRIHEFIDLPAGVTPIKFTEYPDRSTGGETRGVILVEEELASGNIIQMHYEIPFEVDGFLSLNIPENIQFKTTDIRIGETIIPRKDDYWSLSIEDSRLEREPWELVVSADPLDAVDTDHRLDHVLVFKKGDRTDFLSQGSAIVHRETLGSSVREISWGEDEGLLLKMNPIEARATTYTTTLYWTLRNVRPNVLD